MRTNNPAPTSRIKESAVSATTSALRECSRDCGRFGRFAEFSLRPGTSSTCVARRAGTRPNRTAVAMDTANVNPSTSGSIPTRIGNTSPGGEAMTKRTRLPHSARRAPEAPPASARRTLSVKSCRARRVRLAPTAKRTQISRVRAVPRASRRPATLAQAISNTRPTATKRRWRGSENRVRRLSRPFAAEENSRCGISSGLGAGTMS